MKNRKPKSIRIHRTFDVKAKNLKKHDQIWVGKRVYTVKSIRDHGEHVEIFLSWGSRDEKDAVTLTVPRKLVFVVNTNEYHRTAL